jgi:NTP pyrophosphatase (non-canonical NTP hydrolase)
VTAAMTIAQLQARAEAARQTGTFDGYWTALRLLEQAEEIAEAMRVERLRELERKAVKR